MPERAASTSSRRASSVSPSWSAPTPFRSQRTRAGGSSCAAHPPPPPSAAPPPPPRAAAGARPLPPQERPPAEPVPVVEAFTARFESALERPRRPLGPVEQQEVGADLEERIARSSVELLEPDPVPVEETAGVAARGALAGLGVGGRTGRGRR